MFQTSLLSATVTTQQRLHAKGKAFVWRCVVAPDTANLFISTTNVQTQSAWYWQYYPQHQQLVFLGFRNPRPSAPLHMPAHLQFRTVLAVLALAASKPDHTTGTPGLGAVITRLYVLPQQLCEAAEIAPRSFAQKWLLQDATCWTASDNGIMVHVL